MVARRTLPWPTDSLDIREGALDVLGCPRWTRRIRPPEVEGPPLVLLHDGLGSITQWRDLPERMAAALGREVLLSDRPGHGRSPGPGAADGLVWEAEVGLPALLAAWGLSRPLLVGHSDGGTIALHAAALRPDLACGVVSIAAHVFREEVTRRGILAADQAFAEGPLRDGLARHHGAQVATLFGRWRDHWLAPGREDWSLVPLLGGLSVPLLLVQGTEDAYGTFAQLEAIAGAVSGPVRQMRMKGLGHAPHLEDGPGFLEGLGRFLQEI